MKKLIIVCEEKLKIYGNFLSQLISLKDDNDDSVVGTKDGAVAAQVWTEKEYSANAAQISSEQYILFIGNSALIKENRHFMREKFSKYGMKYGWLGKRGVMLVENVVSDDEYDNFIDFASKIHPEIKALEEKNKVLKLPYIENLENESKLINDEALVEEDNDKRSLLGKPKLLKNATDEIQKNGVKLFNAAAKNINKFSGGLNTVVNSKKIEKQEYSFLALLFYLQGLSEFLGFSEDE